jgi:Fur family peroxide stress response transcriptional regulator
MANKSVIKILSENNLRVTPQRTAILEVILNLDNHPTADNIAEYLRINYPHVPVGTVYKNLQIFVNKGIISVVKTSDGFQRYDPVKTKHHHLYSSDSDMFIDYNDKELNILLNEYFKKKKIQNFTVEDFKLQITGKFDKKQ